MIGTWRTACVLLTLLAAACSPTEGERQPGPTSPTPQTPPSAPTPPTSPTDGLQLSGRVLDEDGAPVSGAIVEIDYASVGRASNPPSNCPSALPPFCWVAMSTNGQGEYSIEFHPGPWSNRGLGYVYSFAGGYEVDVQWVPTNGSPAVRDLRLRRTRSVPAGGSVAVLVDARSSLCTDLEDLWALDNRCEVVVIESGPGILNVEARPADGGAVPAMFWYTTGNYGGFITRPAPGSVAIPVRGGTYRVLVGLPEGEQAHQFNVTTTLR